MTMTLISTSTVSSGSPVDITFSSIPQTYTDLYFVISGRSTGGTSANLKINGSNTTVRWLRGNGASASSSSGTDGRISEFPPNTYTSNTFGSIAVYLPNYTSSSAKSFSSDGVSENNATTAFQTITAGFFNTTSPITSLTISSDGFIANSSASLYGILKGSGGATVS